uniref:Cytochrome P450 n=1 Tax=Chenopodium quinoa TaxID=63459 RepID=A0A803MDJ8_CHEQI
MIKLYVLSAAGLAMKPRAVGQTLCVDIVRRKVIPKPTAMSLWEGQIIESRGKVVDSHVLMQPPVAVNIHEDFSEIIFGEKLDVGGNLEEQVIELGPSHEPATCPPSSALNGPPNQQPELEYAQAAGNTSAAGSSNSQPNAASSSTAGRLAPVGPMHMQPTSETSNEAYNATSTGDNAEDMAGCDQQMGQVRESLSEDIATLIYEINVAMGPLTTLFPHLPIPPHRRRDKARKRLDNIFSNIISSRRSSPKSEDDMLQSLINSKYKDGRATTVTEVTGMLITALYGGQRSGSATATWTGAYLVHYKKFWSDAVEEQRRLMKKHGDAITYDVISDMHLLYRCIKEALRLHPPLAMLLRKSHKDFSVTTRKGDKYEIPKGHIIAASPVLSNRVPHIYTNLDSYDPERFCPGREEDRLAGPFSFLSFGGGKHSCIGETFAYLEINTIWSYLIRNFELELTSPFPETEYNEIVWSPKGKVMVRYKRRKLVIE